MSVLGKLKVFHKRGLSIALQPSTDLEFLSYFNISDHLVKWRCQEYSHRYHSMTILDLESQRYSGAKFVVVHRGLYELARLINQLSLHE